jgi:hypothetical protein
LLRPDFDQADPADLETGQLALECAPVGVDRAAGEGVADDLVPIVQLPGAPHGRSAAYDAEQSCLPIADLVTPLRRCARIERR